MGATGKLQDVEMVRVSRELFTDGLPLPTEVYVRMPSGHYLLVGKKADTGNLSQLHITQDKTVDFYVHKDEYPLVISFNVKLIEKTMASESIPPAVKMNLLRGLTDSALSDLVERGISAGSYERCKQISTFVQQTAAQIENFDQFLEIFSRIPGDMVTHSLASSLVALMICDQMSITAKGTLEKVVMGALLHDIGMKEIPKDLLSKKRFLWTDEECLHYESHTIRGVELLRDIKDIPGDVLAIVLEHHENANGMGFPRRLRDIKINPLARIVAVADCFVDLIYDPRQEHTRRTPDEALAYMEQGLGQPFNKSVFLALKQVLYVNQIHKRLRG